MKKTRWTDDDILLATKLINEGKNFKEIGLILNKTHAAITVKLNRLRIMRTKKWTDDDLLFAKELINQGKSFKEIGVILNRTHISVTSKLNRLGFKSQFNKNGGHNKGKTKYVNYDWYKIQNDYNDNNLSYYDLLKKYKLCSHSILWAEKNGLLRLRSRSDSVKLAWKKGKFKSSQQKGYKRYKQLCEFKFNLRDFPNKFDFTLIEKYGWYKAKNRGDNPNGVNRDHMYSIKDGFLNNIDPSIISHPANCELLIHQDNIKKRSKSSITLDTLLKRIDNWECS